MPRKRFSKAMIEAMLEARDDAAVGGSGSSRRAR
jgi:hypothetical protein